jgi:1-acyl-sn-glycerol-3-phosphate acyltransferase
VKSIAGVLTTASLLVPAQMLMQRLARGRQSDVPWLFHRGLCRSLGLQVVSHGQPVRRGPVLFVANHLSWSDIPLLGSKLRGASFIAKSEVEDWGMVGKLATMARTVYVEREARLRVAEQRDGIAGRLARGDRLILFPEGTNGDGVAVLPFKSALFAVAQGVPGLVIQPVTLAYTRVNGLPVTRRQLPALAWVGETALMPHAVDFMGLGRVRAELLFHDPVQPEDFDGRKALARHCEAVVTAGYRQLMRAGGPAAGRL